MKIFKELDLYSFDFWAGAKDTINYLTMEEVHRVQEELEELYPDGIDETTLNDIFWFDDDFIAEILGYNNFEEIIEREV